MNDWKKEELKTCIKVVVAAYLIAFAADFTARVFMNLLLK